MVFVYGEEENSLVSWDKKEKMTIGELLKLNDLVSGYELGRDNMFTQYIEIEDDVDLKIKRRFGMKTLNKRNYRRY
ncbi:MAG: hypothetical protein BWY41_01581 [Candidatus Atribacteria bacterium ADurb.Bin276]|uniref:Uncharacterized protein n=1 Tax=Candidatus Atribacter allofermentans TaxID=1852833 RepID=A0A1V5SMV2_9BACT|nr:MAG: hypothetical protein BWY41_01581 [Candidatus Atribacteria bacterium ADurb.Bin276]